jgi:hypothetical protein
LETSGKKGDIKAKPPGHLSHTMKEFWTHVHSVQNLTERERLILVKAAEAFDSSERCRKQIAKDWMTITDRWGEKNPHPLFGHRIVGQSAVRETVYDAQPTRERTLGMSRRSTCQATTIVDI